MIHTSPYPNTFIILATFEAAPEIFIFGCLLLFFFFVWYGGLNPRPSHWTASSALHFLRQDLVKLPHWAPACHPLAAALRELGLETCPAKPGIMSALVAQVWLPQPLRQFKTPFWIFWLWEGPGVRQCQSSEWSRFGHVVIFAQTCLSVGWHSAPAGTRFFLSHLVKDFYDCFTKWHEWWSKWLKWWECSEES